MPMGIDAPESDQLCRNEDSEHYRCGQKAANDLDREIDLRRDLQRFANQLFGGNSIGLFCLPVLNSQIFLETPGNMAEIGLTRSVG